MSLYQDSKYCYKQVSIFDSKELGRGSYGRVCNALCDDLPCAVKCLHSAIFQLVDSGSVEETAKKKSLFQRECQILFKVHHPCIIQYLDAYIHPDLGEAILVMELADETLNSFLDRSKIPVHIHLQFDICHDIIQALAYLHSCNIIHRNLTGTNVLVSGGCKAKVSDFAMARLVDSFSLFNVQSKAAVKAESVPYMPPEAFKHPPTYTCQLDIFSFGVICLQVITGQYPQPSHANTSEIERRKSELDTLEHPMLPVTLSCLKDRDILRPVASQLCRKFYQLQESSMCKDSRLKRDQAILAVDAIRKELRDVHKKNDELLTRLEHLRYENEQLVQLISTQTENMSSNVKIGKKMKIALQIVNCFSFLAMPYTEPEEFIDIDDVSLQNDGSLDFQMDFSAPHPALYIRRMKSLSVVYCC